MFFCPWFSGQTSRIDITTFFWQVGAKAQINYEHNTIAAKYIYIYKSIS